MKLKYIIASLLLTVGLTFSSCNDDFMQQDPVNVMGGSKYMNKIQDLDLYVQGLYKDFILGHRLGGTNNGHYFGRFGTYAGSPITYGDVFSDNVMYSNALNSRLKDTYDTPPETSKTIHTGWNWDKVKAVNWFLNNYQKVTGSEIADINKIVAEVRFFKAWEYYEKVYAYGDVPWMEKDLNIDSEELYMERTPRKEVADSILSNLNFAIKWAGETKGAEGRINKNMARFLKARFCLFEGTYRKYHTFGGAVNAETTFLFQEAIKAADEIGVMGGSTDYELYHDPKIDNSYWKLFTFLNTPTVDGNKEAILARAYEGNAKSGHDNQRYFQMNNQTRYAMGLTRGFLEEYLCSDGKPIYSTWAEDEASRVKNPLFKGYDGMWEELENRDPRLTQTVCKIGEYASIYDVESGKYGLEEAGLVYPAITFNHAGGYPIKQYGTTVSGYRIIKHFIPSFAEREANPQGKQTALVFRYAELLLIYAEAKEELGEFSQAVADATINKLRERAGFAPSAYLNVGNIEPDPRLDAIYQSKLDYSLTDRMREIRRERRVELAIENQRTQDLMRWKAGKLLTVPVRGMKMTPDKITLYKDNVNNKEVTVGGKTYLLSIPMAVPGNSVELDADKYIIPWPKDAVVKDGILPWSDKRYLEPIPINELILNENLKQNEGWRDIAR